MKIFIDMDGLLADYQLAAALILDIPFKEAAKTYDLNTLLGDKTLADVTLYRRKNFWDLLPVLPAGAAVIKDCIQYRLDGRIEDFFILTSPDLKIAPEQGITGKLAWLKRNFDLEKENVIFTKNKSAIANIDGILLDDLLSNCVSWCAAGGYAAFHWPARFNCAELHGNYFHASQCAEVSRRLLKKTLDSGTRPTPSHVTWKE